MTEISASPINNNRSPVWRNRAPARTEGIASVPAASPYTQAANTVFSVLRQRDHIWDSASAQVTHHFDGAEGLVPVGALFTFPSDCCAHTIELIINPKYVGISLAKIISW